ncbi:MAG: TfoX/Sxy family protein [Chloroflexi bacterium]|nr:MAG: TfoX/Sxy family protein [Chloroflexota bacterium]
MKMPKPSEEAKAALARVVPDEPAVTLKPMFGQLSGFVNGNMFCGIFGEDLFVRLPEDEIAVVKKQGGRDFEPMAGHKMGGYVIVPGDWRAKPPTALIKRALEVTATSPLRGEELRKGATSPLRGEELSFKSPRQTLGGPSGGCAATSPLRGEEFSSGAWLSVGPAAAAAPARPVGVRARACPSSPCR